MKRRVRPEVWVLLILGAVGLLVGGDIARKSLADLNEAAAGSTPPARPTTPPRSAPASRTTTTPQPASSHDALPVGSIAPDFELVDVDGRTRRLSEFKKKKVVLAFYCGCNRCALMAEGLAFLQRSIPPARLPQNIAVVTMDRVALPRWSENTGFKGLFLQEKQTGPVMKKYHGHPCPRVYVLDPGLRIRHVTPSPDDPANKDRPSIEIIRPLGLAMGAAAAGRMPTSDAAAGP